MHPAASCEVLVFECAAYVFLLQVFRFSRPSALDGDWKKLQEDVLCWFSHHQKFLFQNKRSVFNISVCDMLWSVYLKPNNSNIFLKKNKQFLHYTYKKVIYWCFCMCNTKSNDYTLLVIFIEIMQPFEPQWLRPLFTVCLLPLSHCTRSRPLSHRVKCLET